MDHNNQIKKEKWAVVFSQKEAIHTREAGFLVKDMAFGHIQFAPESSQRNVLYSNVICEHGMCHDHDPEWANVGGKKLIPSPGWLGKKTYSSVRCCGKPMLRMQKVQLQQCVKCGRPRYDILERYVALCSCCGRTRKGSVSISTGNLRWEGED